MNMTESTIGTYAGVRANGRSPMKRMLTNATVNAAATATASRRCPDDPLCSDRTRLGSPDGNSLEELALGA
jgi:hypothetical protein